MRGYPSEGRKHFSDGLVQPISGTEFWPLFSLSFFDLMSVRGWAISECLWRWWRGINERGFLRRQWRGIDTNRVNSWRASQLIGKWMAFGICLWWSDLVTGISGFRQVGNLGTTTVFYPSEQHLNNLGISARAAPRMPRYGYLAPLYIRTPYQVSMQLATQLGK